MEHVTAIPSEEDFDRCLKIVSDTMRVDGKSLSLLELKLLTKDIMDTSVMIGGDYSTECIRDLLLNYIKEDFYPRFLTIHESELRGE
ncbi:hypothetical protein [Beduini massiliensis]|uniref:hypothetical protein n=1 Tax=Beduini massiliensis TaxID=1585974 RepID=UPI00059A9EF2|nr:hypothetical protein [Beduini massiliensis]